jgi:branched-chain amino acid transport system substrate-binding protein
MTRPLFAFLLALSIVFPSTAEAARRRSVGLGETIVVGGLFSLTGDGATLGKASAAALDLAARDLNAEFAALGLRYHVETRFFDTKLTPALASEGIRALDAAGASIVIGPQSSAEAGAIVEYANANGILVISQGSTASTLAIPGDNLFRLAPNDRLEGAAVAALMRADGVDVLVPIWRADAGNTGLKDGVKQFFIPAGGSVASGVSYPPSETNFTDEVTALGAAVRAAKTANPAKKVAVYIASFEEGAAILNLARLDPDLVVNWYSGDGLTLSQVVLAPAPIAAFAVTTKFVAPNVALSEQTRDRWEPLSAEIEQKVGFAPDSYGLSVYDAALSAVLAAVEARLRPEALREAFVRNAQRYWGVTGPLALDAAGDRRLADFDFWTVTETGSTVDWKKTASYVSGRLVR